LVATRAFLSGAFWTQALEAEWTIPELFGVNPWEPLARPEHMGLVPSGVFSPHRGVHLARVTPEAAEYSLMRGGTFKDYRFVAGKLHPRASIAVMWWDCPALIGEAMA